MHIAESKLTLPRSIKGKLLKGSAWAFTGKVISVLSALAVNTLLVRILNHEEMGAYFLTFSLVSATAVIAQLGLTHTVVRLISESVGTNHFGRARQSIFVVLRIAAISGIIVTSALAIGGGRIIAKFIFHSESMVQISGLMSVWVALSMFQQLIAEIHRGFHDIKLATLFGGMLTSVLSMTLFLILWLTQGHSNLKEIIFLTLGAGFSSTLISSVILWKHLVELPLSVSERISILDVLRISWPLWITNLTLFALTQADLWVMGLFRSPAEVAVYGIATRLVSLVAMPLLIINAVVPPLISEMYAHGNIVGLERALRSTATFVLLPAILATGLFSVAGGPILGIMFGDYYQSGWVILVILSIGQLANVWSGSCGLTLMMTGHQVTMMAITLLSGLLSVTGACWLVRDYAGDGVAMAAAISMVIHNIVVLLYAKKRTGVWTHANPFMIKSLFGIK